MRVLAVSTPIYAHTVNAVPFLAGLSSRGAEVHWALAPAAVRDGPAVPEDIRTWDTGPVPPFTGSGGRLQEVSERFDWLLADAAERVRAVRRIIETVRPDVVLTDPLGYAGALMSERLGIPWVTFGDGPLHFHDELTPPFGAGLAYRTQRPWVWRNTLVQAASRYWLLGSAQRRYADLRAELGLPVTEDPVLEAALSPHLHLHCGAPELEYPRSALPDHVHFVGTLRPPLPRDWTPPPWWSSVVVAHDGAVLLATQGTLRADPDEVLRPTLRALLAAGRAGVITTGAADPASVGGPGLLTEAGNGPAQVAVEAFVPYERVLPHASLFVTNGGWTGVLLALAHGVPVLQIGRTEEKADIGRRVAWAGAGVHLGSSRPSGRRLRRAIEEAESPGCREGARRIAASLATRDPGRDGADLILALADQRRAIQGA